MLEMVLEMVRWARRRSGLLSSLHSSSRFSFSHLLVLLLLLMACSEPGELKKFGSVKGARTFLQIRSCLE